MKHKLLLPCERKVDFTKVLNFKDIKETTLGLKWRPKKKKNNLLINISIIISTTKKTKRNELEAILFDYAIARIDYN